MRSEFVLSRYHDLNECSEVVVTDPFRSERTYTLQLVFAKQQSTEANGQPAGYPTLAFNYYS